jgi:hypothetical protein
VCVHAREAGVEHVEWRAGNPTVGEWDSWAPALREAQRLGLKLTLHVGEVYNPKETAAMLNLCPDRVGHCCFLDDVLEGQLLASGAQGDAHVGMNGCAAGWIHTIGSHKINSVHQNMML